MLSAEAGSSSNFSKNQIHDWANEIGVFLLTASSLFAVLKDYTESANWSSNASKIDALEEAKRLMGKGCVRNTGPQFCLHLHQETSHHAHHRLLY